MLNKTYLFLVLLVACWTLNPFLKKKSVGNLNSSDYLILNHTLCTIAVIVLGIYMFSCKKCSMNSFRKLTTAEWIWASFAAITTVLASYFLIDLLKIKDASFIIPQLQPCIIVLTLLIGYFLFNEEFTKNKAIGTALIVGGLVIFNYK